MNVLKKGINYSQMKEILRKIVVAVVLSVISLIIFVILLVNLLVNHYQYFIYLTLINTILVYLYSLREKPKYSTDSEQIKHKRP